MLRLQDVQWNSRRQRSRRAPDPPGHGSLSDLSSCKNGPSTSTAASIDQSTDVPVSMSSEGRPEFSLFKCGMSCNEKDLSKTVKVPTSEVKKTGSHSNDHISTFSSTRLAPTTIHKLLFPAVGSTEAWLTPGSIVWAKNSHCEWWPAEVIDEKDVLQCPKNEYVGHVLVQLYGNDERAWVDPIRDLLQFDSCYEERSKNPLQEFQDALQQALFKYSHSSPQAVERSSSDEVKLSHQHGRSDTRGISSRKTNDCSESGRGRRKRKRKVHFDELIIPENPTKKVRCLKIMRYLGLIAPVGSPFAVTN